MLRALEYWKSFVHKWCLDKDELSGHCVYAVAYGSLYEEPRAMLSDVIEFLTGGEEDIDVERLNASVTRHTGNFARYAEQEAEGLRPVSKARDIRAFRYVDDKLAEVEQSLVVDYLTPLGLEQKLAD